MKPQRQRVFSNTMGDCFAACMASLLELPLEVVPNDHSEMYWFTWLNWLKQFGLTIAYRGAGGAIWDSNPWIASVKSLNYPDGTTHAILMHYGGKVLFDPSTHQRYKKGTYLYNGEVVGGYIITVADFMKLHKLQEYRNRLNGIEWSYEPPVDNSKE